MSTAAENEKGRPTTETAPHTITTTSVADHTDTWEVIRTGWACSGDAAPRFGSLAWRALPDGDPVKIGVARAAGLDAEVDLRRHGPGVARALQEMAA